MMFLPRVWDASNEQGHATFYKRWLNLGEDEKPTQVHNIKWALILPDRLDVPPVFWMELHWQAK